MRSNSLLRAERISIMSYHMERNLAEDGRRSASASPLVGNKENAVATENSHPRYPSLSFSSPALKLNFRVSAPISPIQINGPNYGIKTASFDSQQLAAEIVAPYPLSVTPITTHNAIPRVSLSPRYVTKNEKKKEKAKLQKRKQRPHHVPPLLQNKTLNCGSLKYMTSFARQRSL